MANTVALNHALRLNAFGVPTSEIRHFIRRMTTPAERDEIIAALSSPFARLTVAA
jgi:hypothetical protein